MKNPNKEYSTKVVDLNKKRTLSDRKDDSRIEGLVKSIKITDANLSGLNCRIRFTQTKEEILLKPGIPWHFTEARSGLFIVNDIQSGGVIEISISESEHFEIGPLELLQRDAIFLNDGIYQGNNLVDSDPTAEELFPPDPLRSKGEAVHIGILPVWVGTLADLMKPNFKTLCDEVNNGDDVEWNSTSALYLKSDVAPESDVMRVREWTKS